MSTDDYVEAELTEGDLAIAAARTALMTTPIGGEVAPIIPGTLAAVNEYAKAIYASGLAPSSMKNSDQITVAILKGLELGVPPLQALENIAVINGRAAIWGDLGLALVQRSGKVEHHSEGFTGSIAGGDLTAWIKMQRRGVNNKPTRVTYSMEDARTATLWGGMSLEEGKRAKSQWVLRPKVMLMWKARWAILHMLFSDILRNMPGVEDLQDEVIIEGTVNSSAPRRSIERPRQDIRSRLSSGNAPAFTYAERTQTAGEGNDTSHHAEPATGEDGGAAGTSRAIAVYDQIAAAIAECKSSAEVQVVADEYAAAISMLDTLSQQRVDALLSDRRLELVGGSR